jgi:uncharacterized protein YqgC (DUF456 family)
MLLQALGFGLAVAFMIIGVIGVIVPVIPGTFLIWLTTVIYAWATDFEIITPIILVAFTIVSLVTGLADFWLPLLGAKQRGASKRGMFLGVVGGLIGTIIFPLVGTIIGYGLGILLGEYHKRRDWQTSWRASLGGMAGWGVATAVQLGGAIFMLVVFVVRVLTA